MEMINTDVTTSRAGHVSIFHAVCERSIFTPIVSFIFLSFHSVCFAAFVRTYRRRLEKISGVTGYECGKLRELFLFGSRPRAFRNHRRAQANSIARMASPAGITIKAGPGSTKNATPIASTVPPTTRIVMRLIVFSEIISELLPLTRVL